MTRCCSNRSWRSASLVGTSRSVQRETSRAARETVRRLRRPRRRQRCGAVRRAPDPRAAPRIRTGCRSAACRVRTRTAARATRTRSGSGRAERLDDRDAGLDRPERSTIGDVDLAAAARRPACLWKRRLEQRRPEVHARQARAFSRGTNRSGIDPRRADELERLGRAASFGNVRAFEQHGARIHDRALERRDVRRRQHPRQAGLVEVLRPRDHAGIATTSSLAPMPKSSLNSRASSPIVMPWRIGIGYWPTNDSNPRSSIGPSTSTPPIGFGRSQTTTGRPCLRGGDEAVRHRVDVGVDPRADVLQIDHERVEPREHLRGRLARLAVERVHRHVPPRVASRAATRSCSPADPIESRAAGRRWRRRVTPAASARSMTCRNSASIDAGLHTRPIVAAAEQLPIEEDVGAENETTQPYGRVWIASRRPRARLRASIRRPRVPGRCLIGCATDVRAARRSRRGDRAGGARGGRGARRNRARWQA